MVAGHIWPLQLGFRGGRGISTSLGVFAGCDVRIVPNCDHFYGGREDAVAGIVTEWLTGVLAQT